MIDKAPLALRLCHSHAKHLLQQRQATQLARRCGGGAQAALAEAGIRLYGGVSGSCDAAVEAFLAGALAYDPHAKCEHHAHEHGDAAHTCGTHGCGKQGCH